MEQSKVLGKSIKEWHTLFPLLNKITKLEPVVWTNTNCKKMRQVPSLPISKQDIFEAERLWKRFAPFLAKAFPETSDGIVESPLIEIRKMKERMQEYYQQTFEGSLYLKCDNQLPIAGSIKARGGVYEVLRYAEKLALENDLVSKDDNYEVFSTPKFKDFFNNYTIGVGSTGNLALSIGTISTKLGFNVDVHMSADAKSWKKKLLRNRGAKVYEYTGDFSEAIAKGRALTIQDPKGYFVDDEDSKHLFLGYSVAALRLKKQIEYSNIIVDQDHPLIVYMPCGVGGAPGGITFGLKQTFGDNVHCVFVEPTHSPSVLIGMMTGENEKVSVQGFDIDNLTEADGLAVGRPSRFASEISKHLVSTIYTIEDDEFHKLLALLADSEKIYIEPSATAGLLGPMKIKNLLSKKADATHVIWATGGALVPKDEMDEFYLKGKALLDK
ncbi:D-serine ammonia-lyase [Halobacillus seohaensis]|uniref:Probable D-serine dehydratase n=1 Tax=Halobacillus seohaensis TaxID=447421 RepID=A0ABW2EIJ0_9BACI